ISKIPKDRWDWEALYGDPTKDKNKTDIKWGGLINGIRDFDPMFFGISPREAELMDPQQRLLMLYVWKAIEDASITPEALSQKPTGVFISPGMNEYMYMVPISKNDPFAMTGLALSAIPNRISYAFNLAGPSEYCETACSSALVALHRAIASIRAGECEQAVIGAVNLLLSPVGFIGFETMGYLSPKGKAKSFQAEADGYVRSEGVGAVIIKPLQKAINDHDRIYAVIRGTGVSHGGKGMSLIAPTGRGMKTAMLQAYRDTGIDPKTVSYVEAHGTATPMGDTIELDALKSGYNEIAASYSHGYSHRLQAKTSSYISCLKPCIGHAEIASGMAALIKVVMALNNKIIPGLPGFKSLNKNISLKGSRFEITAENHKWNALTDNDGKELPRRAAINSYGFGGVNAHAVIEEYVEEGTRAQSYGSTKADEQPVIFVLSAKNEERLKAYAVKMEKFLNIQNFQFDIADVAYTLQIGRKAMENRLAMVVNNKEELINGLKAYLQSIKEEGESAFSIPIFTGNRKKVYPEIKSLLSGKTGEAVLQILLAEKDLEKLSNYWVKGFDVPWESLYKGKSVRKISLPTYPFEKRRCWIEASNKVTVLDTRKGRSEKVEKEKIHEEIDFCGESRHQLKKMISSLLNLSEEEIGYEQKLSEYGFNSLIAIKLLSQIEDMYHFEISPDIFSRYDTIEKLDRYLTKEMNIQGVVGNGVTEVSKRGKQLENFLGYLNKADIPQDIIGVDDSGAKRSSVNSAFILKAYRDTSKVVFSNFTMCNEIFFAMDIIPFNVEMLPTIFSYGKIAPEFLDIAEENHFSRDVCSVSRLTLGVAIKDCFPKPDFLVHSYFLCDTSMRLFHNLADMYQKRIFSLNVPANDDEESISFLTDRLLNMVDRIQENFGVEHDPERLKKAIGYSNETIVYLNKIYDHCRREKILMKSSEAIETWLSLFFCGSAELLNQVKYLHKEITETIKNGIDRDNNNAKVTWIGLMPFYGAELINYIEDECNIDLVSPPFDFMGRNVPANMDPDNPYRDMAKILIGRRNIISSPKRIQDMLDKTDEYRLDGIILFNTWGCRPMLGSNRIIKDIANRKEIPVLEISGDYIDERNHSFSQLKVRIDAFAEILQRKLK
ncbi:MAG: hypothetical protein GY850_21920, partial [bacterium]|nr:hypothetical protein [bacterium]